MTTNGILKESSPCREMCNAVKCWKWDISQLISRQPDPVAKYAVLVLNRTISQNQDFIKNFWNNALLRVTVDGGTIHWNTFFNKLPSADQEVMKLPELVTGDFDSITEDVLQKFKKKGCKICHTPNQDHTDFTKAVMEVNKYCKTNNTELDHVVAICQSSGRVDQILGNIQTLFLVKENHLLNSNTKVYILSDDSISWLLCPGDHVISIPEETRKHKKAWCSLVPIGEACMNVTTSGLKWNLDHEPLQYGVLVSTSNTFDGSEQVKIKCSHTLLWSMRIPSVAG
ncbi:thiamine pyrophosphokinase 1 isoform X2 [Epargyreus clarus]|uniref:thiamine pyrophosphokinase 1 isoform X2 n=1 Tax=Epargyreus clarus TaxID=520877 RepID=UPI003C2B5E88